MLIPFQREVGHFFYLYRLGNVSGSEIKIMALLKMVIFRVLQTKKVRKHENSSLNKINLNIFLIQNLISLE
jgi:hypothetical protein